MLPPNVLAVDNKAVIPQVVSHVLDEVGRIEHSVDLLVVVCEEGFGYSDSQLRRKQCLVVGPLITDHNHNSEPNGMKLIDALPE